MSGPAVTTQVREHGQRIAEYPTGKLGAAQSQWLQDTGAQLVSVDTLHVHLGLLLMQVLDNKRTRELEILMMVG